MKAKVIIEDGNTTILLTPENDFEEFVVEQVEAHNVKKYSVATFASTDKAFGVKSKHQIEICITRRNEST